MRFPFSLLGLSAVQTAFQSPAAHTKALTRTSNNNFALKDAHDVFSPRNLIELGRPGLGVANDAGDLVLVPYSQFALEAATNNKSIFIASLDSESRAQIEIALPKGGEAFWLDDRTVGHAVEGANGTLELYALPLDFQSNLTADAPVSIGSLPTKTATNFRYANGVLIFVDYVYGDGNITAAPEQDAIRDRRPNAGMVFDQLNERFWDSWSSPKAASLFSVNFAPVSGGKWEMGTFANLLRGTGHSSDDFFFAGGDVLYTARDPELPEGLSQKRNVFIVSLADPGNPVQLTTGRQGGTGSPVLSSDGKAAWIQQDEDRGGSSIPKIIIYDLVTRVRFTLAPKWDSGLPQSLAFSLDGDVIYFTGDEHARVKIFALPIPPTPAASTTHPVLPHKFNTPVALTHKASASGIQILPDGRLLFSQSSYSSPNDVFVLRDLKAFEIDLKATSRAAVEFKGKTERITHLTADALKGKDLDGGEEFWFKGALGRDVQGWLFKPKGWNKKDEKKWPVAMIIHGGPHSSHADGWSTRWNPNVFAQQDFFSIWINPTGSTGFGAEFADSINEDWGGKPFVDMQKGFKYILDAYPQIDPDRAVAAGASWGGYAINWLQGHPEYGFNFKALVCHDGVFDSAYSSYTSDVPSLFNDEFGGVPWSKESQAIHKRNNPASFIHRWSTPQLVIHGSKDYRLPETESIGAFHALQQLGIPSRLLIFPAENHWVLDHENSLKWHYEVFKWFDEFVGEHGSE
ncbi:Alpha/Beta hydrolase protein [Mycena metata]|uniref:Dipeptidyl-peptidase V n=1 Tax=Mycena metata TaxID=1033252 RepID=A0AAD7KFF9_9AGAR|nr:Alpha/Beta hydrolase protein [Mycena metata]